MLHFCSVVLPAPFAYHYDALVHYGLPM